jgi:hypothetical protein
MSEKMLIEHCSPTLAGIKTGSLFSCKAENINDVKKTIRALNRLLAKKGLRILPLRYRKGRVLVYVYRPAYLTRDLGDTMAREILNERGYSCKNTEACVAHLKRILADAEDFPHEIGLFLGYPPEDVRGFIENKAEGFKFVGYWKVYGDETKAKHLFEKYKKCTDVYSRHFAGGKPLERLTVVG